MQTASPEKFFESIENSPDPASSPTMESLSSSYRDLKQKYTKLYKEHSLLLKSIESDKVRKKEKSPQKLFNSIAILNSKINSQEQEIAHLHKTIDNLNTLLEPGPKYSHPRRSTNSFSFPASSFDSLEISADISLMNFLVHRLLLSQKISREDLLEYRYALQRIEDKFEELTCKLKIKY